MVSFCCSLLTFPLLCSHSPSGVLPGCSPLSCPRSDMGHRCAPERLLPCGSFPHLPKILSPCAPWPLWLLPFLKCIWAEAPRAPSTWKICRLWVAHTSVRAGWTYLLPAQGNPWPSPMQPPVTQMLPVMLNTADWLFFFMCQGTWGFIIKTLSSPCPKQGIADAVFRVPKQLVLCDLFCLIFPVNTE